MYFTHVARIFEDAEVSRPDIQRMIDARGGGGAYMMPAASETIYSNVGTAGSNHGREPGVTNAGATVYASGVAAPNPYPLPFPDDWSPPVVSPALIRFKHSWEAFIDSLLREWKTLNLVSALLLSYAIVHRSKKKKLMYFDCSAIITMFQIPDAEGDPLTRTTALFSLVCALMSLSYGCIYIVRFGTMRSMYRASRWAEVTLPCDNSVCHFLTNATFLKEARKANTVIWWNVWVLLAMPAIWIAWYFF
jgi:hypothetical protein